MKILIIEDDPTLNKNISEALVAEDMVPESVFDGQLAERMLKRATFDCIIMDINLPGISGFERCKHFRAYNKETPMLVLTSCSELVEEVKGFDCGADDYLTKPFFMRELILRIQSLIKRSQHSPTTSQDADVIVAGDLFINQAQKSIFGQETEIALTPREYQVLLKLCQNKGEVISKNKLMEEIWGTSFDTNTHTIEVYINFWRNKVDKPFGKNSIKTKVGYGYYFDSKE